MTASAFGHDDPLMPELLSWISCAAVLGGLAGSVAVNTCCKAIRQAAGCASVPALQQSGSDSDAEFDEQLAMYEEDTQQGQALDKASRMSSWTFWFSTFFWKQATPTERLSAPPLHAQPDDSMSCHGAYCLCCEHFAANLQLLQSVCTTSASKLCLGKYRILMVQPALVTESKAVCCLA